MAEIGEVGGWATVISKVLSGEELDARTVGVTLEVILEGNATPAQILSLIHI